MRVLSKAAWGFDIELDYTYVMPLECLHDHAVETGLQVPSVLVHEVGFLRWAGPNRIPHRVEFALRYRPAALITLWVPPNRISKYDRENIRTRHFFHVNFEFPSEICDIVSQRSLILIVWPRIEYHDVL